MKRQRKKLIDEMKFCLTLILFLVLTACGNDGKDGVDGQPGVAGPPGPPGPSGQEPSTPTSLVATVQSVIINSKPVVNFTVVDQDGFSYSQLSAPRFMLAKLVASTNGNTSFWQSYINRIEVANNVGPGVEDKVQATQDRNGELVNNGGGSYTYTFETDITNVASPLVVNYEPDSTHRLAIQISGNDQPATNAVFTWRPSDGATTAIYTRDIVKTETCNACHDKLALHGGGRLDTNLCVTCHNPGSIDANSGNTVDMTAMIHKIHRGANLPSVQAGEEYAIWGFRDTKHNYSNVRLPMDIRNCNKCHDETDIETPDAANWQNFPTIEACGSCHDNIDFALGQDGGHEGGVMTDNSACTVCHREGGFVGSVAESHLMAVQVAASAFKNNILNISNTAPGEFPSISFSITNPLAGDAAYDILNDSEFNASGGASRLSVGIAWNTRDYTNEGSDAGVASTVSINPLNSAIDNADGSFTVTSSVAIPPDQSGSGAISIEGHPAIDLDGDGTYSDRVPVQGIVEYFAITDSSASPRRSIVTIEKCQACHVNLNLHGKNRNDNIEQCVTCHNPSSTDLLQRPVNPTDGLVEQSIDMKTMIHAIHASAVRENDYIVYGFGGSEHNYGDIHYPGNLSNCETCHLDGTYELPLDDNVQGITISSGPLIDDQSDDIKVTATAGVCASCHDDQLTRAHMIQNGGASFSTSQEAINNFEVVETCLFCHGPGNSEDLKEVHGIN